MYLKKLEIQGFKSFADKVEFDFTDGITAIVGPNGSGKSNVVDSIRWVLGEQSAKSLRGGKMDDVIFAGSADRRAVGMAQVALTLDNSGGLFAIDYHEVTITRRLYRSGESEYLINKSPCRLKDIHELFMDTGLGREGLSIISQGKVDEILSLKPEDRRGLIEEAAGIIKYKYRKKEAEKKLEDTEEHMTRITDIVSELEERVEPLSQQAEKAKQYQQYKSELKGLEITIEVVELEKYYVQECQLKEQLDGYIDEVSSFSAQQGKLDAMLLEQKQKNQIQEDEISLQQQQYYSLQGELEKNNSQWTIAKQLMENYQEQLAKITIEVAGFEEKNIDLEKEKIEMEKEFRGLEEGFIQEQVLAQQYQEKQFTHSTMLEKISNEVELIKEKSIENMQAQAKCNNRIQGLSQEISNEDKRKERLGQRILRLNEETMESQIQLSQLEDLQIQWQQKLDQSRQKNERLLQQLYQKNIEFTEMQANQQQTENHYQQVASKLQALKDLEQSGEGYQFGVKSVLEGKKSGKIEGVIGTVAQLVQVPSHLERAIETVLGGALQNIVMDHDSNAQKAIAYLKQNKKGRATFLPLTTMKGSKTTEKLEYDSVLGLAVDLISFEEPYRQIMNYLLGRIWIVKDLESAVTIGKQKGFQYRLVTLEGDIITPGGALTGGNFQNNKTGILSRSRQIDQLSIEQQQLLEKTNTFAAQVGKINDEIVSIQQQLEKEQKEDRAIELQCNDLLQKIDQKRQEQQRLKSDLALEHGDMQELEHDMKQIEVTLGQEQQHKELLTIEAQRLEVELKEHKEKLNQINIEYQVIQQQQQQHAIEKATSQQRYQLIKEQYEQLVSRTRQSEEQLQEKKLDRDVLQEKIEQKEKEILAVKLQMKTQGQTLQQYSEQLDEKKTQKQAIQSEIDLLEAQIKELQKKLEQMRNQQYSIDIQRNKIVALIESGQKRLQQNYGYQFEEAVTHKVEIEDMSQASKRVQKLKSLIHGLGNINFNAVEEYKEVTNRLEFLNIQVQDLIDARESLYRIIKDIEQIMSEKFKETYQVVNATFSNVFHAMFGGGQARLELSYPEDYLLTGIEIIAQPPGKKEQILTLLSGGERAMTAIALLFALLTVKPSPFCILDEIEAALDDVNVDRFANFLKDYTHKTQFIVISHRKGTMEAADVLYGVSMENNGVSRLMSVKLSEYGQSI